MQRHHAARRRGPRSRARARGPAAGEDDALPERVGRVCGPCRRRRRGRVHAGSAPVRRCRGGRRQDRGDPFCEHPRNRRLVRGGEAGHAQDRGLAGACRNAGPRSGAACGLQVGGAVADRGSGGGRAALGGGAWRAVGRHGPRHRAHRRSGVARRAELSDLLGRARAGDRLAWRLQRRMDAAESDRPRPVHPVQRLHPCLPRAGDRFFLPDRPRSLQGASGLRRRVRRGQRHRLRAPRHEARRALRSRARLEPRARVADARAAAGLSRSRRRPGGAGAGGGRPRGDGRRVRKAQILQLQGGDLRA